MYEFEAIFFLALLFIIVYFIGSIRNKRLNIKYAKFIKQHMTPYSEFVGFRAFGRGGFRSLCQLKKEMAYSRIEIAVALVDRENLMHYPLSLLTEHYDRLVCWGFLKDAVPIDIEILPTSDRKSCRKIALQKQLKEVALRENKLKESFTFLASNPDVAEKFLADSSVKRCLMEAGDFVKRLSLDKNESRVYLMGELREESLKPLLNLLFSFAKQPIRTQ